MGYERPPDPELVKKELELDPWSPVIPRTPRLPTLPVPMALRNRRGFTEPVYSNVWFSTFRYN